MKEVDSVSVCYHTQEFTKGGKPLMQCILEKDSQGQRYFELRFGEHPVGMVVFLNEDGLDMLMKRLTKAKKEAVKERQAKLAEHMKKGVKTK